MKIVYILIMIVSIMGANSLEDKIKVQNKEVIKAAVEGLSETLPQKVDKYTTLVKMTAKDERLIYTYAIDDPKLSDKEIALRGQKKMKAPVTRGICESSMRFLESGIAITYRYIGAKSKKELFSFDVQKKDCSVNL